MTESIHAVVERLRGARNFVNDIIWDRGLRAQMKQFATDVDEAATLISELQAERDRLRQALEFVRDGYDRIDVNHVDYRVKVYGVALDALAGLGTDTSSLQNPSLRVEPSAEQISRIPPSTLNTRTE